MKKHYNKRWLEQRWDARQPERLEHIRLKQQLKSKKEANANEEPGHEDHRMCPDSAG